VAKTLGLRGMVIESPLTLMSDACFDAQRRNLDSGRSPDCRDHQTVQEVMMRTKPADAVHWLSVTNKNTGAATC
jgi:hypothetical protein